MKTYWRLIDLRVSRGAVEKKIHFPMPGIKVNVAHNIDTVTTELSWQQTLNVMNYTTHNIGNELERMMDEALCNLI
jgi:hypothetical protein